MLTLFYALGQTELMGFCIHPAITLNEKIPAILNSTVKYPKNRFN
jgi:hypothetical protein